MDNTGNNDIFFSVIIPAYNAGRFVSKAIESVIAQTYENWELIIVDDGSTDDTGSICDRYASRDSRISVIHQENAGKVKGWQRAVKAAKGDHICTVDADDWVEDCFLKYFRDQLTKKDVDIICYQFYSHRPGKWDSYDGTINVIEEYYGRNDEFYISGDEFLDFVLETSYHMECRCFKRSLFEYSDYEKNAFENNKIIFNTDLYQVPPLICNSREVLMTCKCLGHYRISEGSISNTSKNIPAQIINVLDSIEYLYTSLSNRDKLTDARKRLVFYEFMRQMYPRMRQVVRDHIIDRKKMSEIASHPYYKKFRDFYVLSEVRSYCKDRNVGFISTFGYYMAFKMMIGPARRGLS